MDQIKNSSDKAIKASEIAVHSYDTLCRPILKMTPKPSVVMYLINLGTRIGSLVEGSNRLKTYTALLNLLNIASKESMADFLVLKDLAPLQSKPISHN
jgi:hypothetical protein